MKQGISLFSFSENTDVRWMFEHAKKAGYDGVEPVLSESGYLNPQTPEKDVLAMKRMADDMGLEIPSVGVWSLWQNNLVSDSEKTRQKAFGIVQKQIDRQGDALVHDRRPRRPRPADVPAQRLHRLAAAGGLHQGQGA